MLQHEFESRVGIEVSAQEYISINAVYECSDVEKDEFCKLWVKMNRNRVARIKAQRKAAAQFKAIPIEEQVLVKLTQLAQQRAEETGCTLPVSDVECDAHIVRENEQCSDFTVYFVLRNTGSAIVRTFTDALAEKNSFGNKNATTIYTVHVNRTMNIGSIVIANGNNIDKVIF